MVGDSEDVTIPAPGGVAERLREARLAADLSLEDISARTRVATRYLQAIEEGRFADLASRTYAVGFARAYARTVGLPEQEIAAEVRAETQKLDETERPRQVTFEPGDPTRVPGRGLAWLGVFAAVLLIAGGFAFWRTYFVPAVPLSDLVSEPAPVASAPPAPRPLTAAVPTGGAVVFTATEPNLWVKFYDASGKQLMQKQLAQGESYTVPAGAVGPKLWTGRADALAITIGGKPVAQVSAKPGKVKDVPVDAASLLARPPSGAPPLVAPTAAPVAATSAPLPSPAAT
jgi:transcriptional regulator with XRE-family HTH domain